MNLKKKISKTKTPSVCFESYAKNEVFSEDFAKRYFNPKITWFLHKGFKESDFDFTVSHILDYYCSRAFKNKIYTYDPSLYKETSNKLIKIDFSSQCDLLFFHFSKKSNIKKDYCLTIPKVVESLNYPILMSIITDFKNQELLELKQFANKYGINHIFSCQHEITDEVEIKEEERIKIGKFIEENLNRNKIAKIKNLEERILNDLETRNKNEFKNEEDFLHFISTKWNVPVGIIKELSKKKKGLPFSYLPENYKEGYFHLRTYEIDEADFNDMQDSMTFYYAKDGTKFDSYEAYSDYLDSLLD